MSAIFGTAWGGVLTRALLCVPEAEFFRAEPAVVYLDRVGLVGTTIGALFAAAEIASGFGALFAGRAMRLGDAQCTMRSGTALSILPMPLQSWCSCLLFQIARGWPEGVIQPVVRVRSDAISRARWSVYVKPVSG